MTQQQILELLVWVFTVGVPSAVIAVARISKRQNENRVKIAKTENEVKTVKTDLRDEVLGEILEAKREWETKAETLTTEVKVLRDQVNVLNEKLKTAEGENSKLRLAIEQQAETYKSQLTAKENELSQAKADLKVVTSQLDNALKDFVEQNKQHASDILELKTEMALSQAQIKGYQAVFELAMKSNIALATPPTPDAPPPVVDAGDVLPKAG